MRGSRPILTWMTRWEVFGEGSERMRRNFLLSRNAMDRMLVPCGSLIGILAPPPHEPLTHLPKHFTPAERGEPCKTREMDTPECVQATPRRILALAVAGLAITHTAAHAGSAVNLLGHSALPAAALSRVQRSKSQIELGGVDVTVIKGSKPLGSQRCSIFPSSGRGGSQLCPSCKLFLFSSDCELASKGGRNHRSSSEAPSSSSPPAGELASSKL